MLLEPGVVLGALDGEVEGDFQAVLGGSGDQPAEVFAAAQLRVDRIVAAFGAADRVGLPGSPGSACRALLRPLRCCMPMGWIGGKYSTSKPMSRIIGRRACTSLKVPWRVVGDRTREQLVPAGKRAGRSTSTGNSRLRAR
jgi:hypothetical protein